MWGLVEMCERGRIFNAGFAGFCAVFRRGERGRIFNAGFAGFCAVFRMGEGVWRAGMFFIKIVALRKNIGVTLW